MQLTDFSSLKAPPDATVTIPLNGVNYHAIADIAADVVLSAASVEAADDVVTLPEGVSLDQLADTDPATAARLERAGASNLVRLTRFMEQVMEPDSWATWCANMKMPDKGLTPAARKKHLERMITLRQLLAVFRALLAHYSGRPTEPSSSSPNGDGGTGGTSTETAPSEG